MRYVLLLMFCSGCSMVHSYANAPGCNATMQCISAMVIEQEKNRTKLHTTCLAFPKCAIR